MSSWDEFCDQRRGALERFVNGDAGRCKQLWSHADDVTVFGGWGGYEQGWDAVSRRLDWAASRFGEGHVDICNLAAGSSGDLAYSAGDRRPGDGNERDLAERAQSVAGFSASSSALTTDSTWESPMNEPRGREEPLPICAQFRLERGEPVEVVEVPDRRGLPLGRVVGQAGEQDVVVRRSPLKFFAASSRKARPPPGAATIAPCT
jgi:hypothetical protein